MSWVGQTIGRLHVTGTLGKGGMGEVYVAWDPTLERKVALKSIRFDQRFDAEARARLLREARILSRLDHPGICRLFELFEHPGGDFLVMELIEGQSLRRALQEGLEPSARIFIAERVAEALAVAHAEGITHRDLKPDNVMLTDDGAVKVLDFGLADIVGRQPLDADPPEARPASLADLDPSAVPSPDESDPSWEPTVLASPESADSATVTLGAAGSSSAESGAEFRTERGTIMGTIAYMSPEQARGARATAASDMYAFGLLIQEVFTGRPAYPPKLATLELLVKASEGDTRPLEGVDPDLGALIERLLSMVPEARPSATETLDRLLWIGGKRRRLWRRFVAAAAVVVLLFIGFQYTLGLRRERAAAVAAQRQAEQVSDFLIDVFAVSQPQRARGREITARELLDRGAERVVELADQPRQQSRMMQTIGQAYRQIGAYDRARPLLNEALAIRQRLGADDLETASALDQLASLEHDVGQFDRAAEHFSAALELRRTHLGADHPHVATSLNNLGVLERARGDDAAAERLLTEALAIYQANDSVDPAGLAGCWLNLGDLYRARGDLDAAVAALDEAIASQERYLGANHPDLAAGLNNLAMVRHQLGEPAVAETLYRRALDLTLEVLGDDHPQVATAWNNLGALLRQTGRFDEALELHGRALTLHREALGEAHPMVAVTLTHLGDTHLATGRLDAARSSYEQAAAIQRTALGDEHPELAVTLNHTADLDRRAGDLESAETLYRQALAMQLAAFDDDHPSVVISRVDLADLLVDRGRLDESEALARAAAASAEAWLEANPDDRDGRLRWATILATHARRHAARGETSAAVERWRQVLDVVPAPDPDATAFVLDLHWRAVALRHLGRHDEALPWIERLHASGWRHPELEPLGR